MVKYEIEKPQAMIWQIWSPRQGQGRPEKKRRSAIPSKKTPASTVFSSWRIVLPHLEWIAIGQRASFPPSQWRISFASTSCLASRSDRQNGMAESGSGSSEWNVRMKENKPWVYSGIAVVALCVVRIRVPPIPKFGFTQAED